MADNRNQGRQNTHDTGSPQARARDDLRTANKTNEQRDEQRDREAEKPKQDEDEGTFGE
jgi:hypothetical protein